MLTCFRKPTVLLVSALLLNLGACSDENPKPSFDATRDVATDTTDVGVDAVDQGVDGQDMGEDVDDATDALTDPALDPDPDIIDEDVGLGPPPLDGFGTVSGQCDFLDDDVWGFNGSFIFTNTLDFGSDQFDDEDLTLLSEGGQQMVADGGLNDSSLLSEIFAYEMLYRCELAEHVKSEGDILYENQNGPKTDILVNIDGRNIGVSVVRAHPLDNPYDLARAQEQLEGKLQGIINSTANMGDEDTWERQILAVITADASRLDLLTQAYPVIGTSLTRDTIVILTLTNGEDEPLYCDTSEISCPSP